MPRDGTLPEMPSPEPRSPALLEIALVQEWQAAQLGQAHVADALNKVIEAWQKDRILLAETRAELAAMRKRVSELEAEIT